MCLAADGFKPELRRSYDAQWEVTGVVNTASSLKPTPKDNTR